MALTLRNAELDRLARDLSEVDVQLRTLAGLHARRQDAMRFVHDDRLADFHGRAREQVLALAAQVGTYVEHLRAREPLWDKGTQAVHARSVTGLRRSA